MKVKLIKEWVKPENGWVSKARGSVHPAHLRHLCGNDSKKHTPHLNGDSYSFVVDEAKD